MVSSTSFQDKGMEVVYREGLERRKCLSQALMYKKNLDKERVPNNPLREKKIFIKMSVSLKKQHIFKNSIVEHCVEGQKFWVKNLSRVAWSKVGKHLLRV